MKYIKYFLLLVEFQTKLISILMSLFIILFYTTQYETVNYLNFGLFFISLVLIDMNVTAVNHISGILFEKNISKYDKTITKQMEQYGITMRTNYIIIGVMAVIAIVVGIILVYLSNIGVLLLGALAFVLGIAYSIGPKPISYTMFGELVAGGLMGVLIPVVAIFTQYDTLPWHLNPLIFITFLPFAFLIANVLYANNLADLEMDVSNNRYTLAYYTKKQLGYYLLLLSQLGVFALVVLCIVIGFLPLYTILLLLLAFPSFKNINKFAKTFEKQNLGFILNNFMMFNLLFILLLIVDIIIN